MDCQDCSVYISGASATRKEVLCSSGPSSWTCKDLQISMQIPSRWLLSNVAKWEKSSIVRNHLPRPPLQRQAWVRGAGLVGWVSRICCTNCSTENSSDPFP